MLKIAKDLSLPLDVVTQTIGIVAKKRSGKSYLARKLTEQLHHSGQQVVIVDPKGDWWGIRSTRDGKGAGLPIVIIGGERGDVPLEASGGEVVAKLVVEERVSALLDLSLLRKHEVATFMAAFMESLYRLKAAERYRTPVMLIIDEADAIAPQKPQPNEARMLGAAEDIVRRGGQRGIGCTMVTQRTAVLNKNILTQCQLLIALRTISPQDLAAMNAWVDVHGTQEQRKTLMSSLPSLPVGDAWVWSPGWPTDGGIFQRIHTLPIDTFDSGATPKPGQKRVEPKKVADVDLEAVRAQMAATIERAKADDPKELRKRVAALERDLASKVAPAADAGELKRLQQENQHLHDLYDKAGAAFREILVETKRHADALAAHLGQAITSVNPLAASHRDKQAAVRPPQAAAAPAQSAPRSVAPKGGTHLPEGERKILMVIAQTSGGATREQLTVTTGYKRSSRDTYLQRLSAKGYVYTTAGRLWASEAGSDALGDFEPLPTGDALLRHWLGQLPEGERKILALVARSRKGMTRDAISEATDYKRSSRDTYLQRLSQRRLITTSKDGVAASEELFG